MGFFRDWFDRQNPRQQNDPSGTPRHKITVDYSPWENVTRPDEIVRAYLFGGLDGPDSRTQFEIRCNLARVGRDRHLQPAIYFAICPRLFENTGYISAMFAPSNRTLDYKILNLKIELAATSSNLLFVAEDDMDQCLDALMLGEQLTFRLMNQDGQVAFFPLENDASFGAVYRELAQQIV